MKTNTETYKTYFACNVTKVALYQVNFILVIKCSTISVTYFTHHNKTISVTKNKAAIFFIIFIVEMAQKKVDNIARMLNSFNVQHSKELRQTTADYMCGETDSSSEDDEDDDNSALDNVAVTRDAEHQDHNNTDFSFVDNSKVLNLANAVTQDTEHYDQPLVHVSLMQPSQCVSKSEEEMLWTDFSRMDVNVRGVVRTYSLGMY